MGYDPSIIPGWTSPEDQSFGIIRLRPWRLRVMAGTVLLSVQGELPSWTGS